MYFAGPPALPPSHASWPPPVPPSSVAGPSGNSATVVHVHYAPWPPTSWSPWHAQHHQHQYQHWQQHHHHHSAALAAAPSGLPSTSAGITAPASGYFGGASVGAAPPAWPQPSGPQPSVSNTRASTPPSQRRTAAAVEPPAPPPGCCNRELIVNYLDDAVDDDALRALFRRVAPVESARVMRDAHTGESLGFGFVYMETAEGASRAVATLHRSALRKKRLRVAFANPRRPAAPPLCKPPRDPATEPGGAPHASASIDSPATDTTSHDSSSRDTLPSAPRA